MTNDDFQRIVDVTFQMKSQLLKAKGKLYGNESDRLSQFKQMSSLSGLTSAQCAYVLASKHFTALRNILFDQATTCNMPIIDEITGDIINYMLLIKAIMQEELDESRILGQVSTNYLPSSISEQQMSESATWGGLGQK